MGREQGFIIPTAVAATGNKSYYREALLLQERETERERGLSSTWVR